METLFHQGEILYIFEIATAYPLRNVGDYINALNKIKELREKIKAEIQERKIDKSTLEEIIKKNETGDLGKAYLKIMDSPPYDVAVCLNKIDPNALNNFFSNWIIFLRAAETYIEKMLEIRKKIEEHHKEAKKLGIKYNN